MAASGVSVEGLSKALRQLKELGVDVSDLKEAFGTIAAEAADLIADLAPVGNTGALAASVRGNRAQSKAVVRAGRAAVKYAGPINYGWPKRGIEPSLFMQEGEAEYEPRAVDRLEEEIEKAILRRGLK